MTAATLAAVAPFEVVSSRKYIQAIFYVEIFSLLQGRGAFVIIFHWGLFSWVKNYLFANFNTRIIRINYGFFFIFISENQ
jgi:hypothetical protein